MTHRVGVPAKALLALADRILAINAPDRRLDAEIDCALVYHDLRPARPDDHVKYRVGIPPNQGDIWTPTGFLMARFYTNSIDEAATLVPPGDFWRWLLDRRACVSSRADGYRAEVTLSGRIEPNDNSVWAAHPAVALTVAALRAHALVMEVPDG